MNQPMVKVWLLILFTIGVAYGGYKIYQTNGPIKKKTKKTVVTYAPPTDQDVVAELAGEVMVDRHDKAFRFDSLKGKVWVVNMFFTDCPGECLSIMRTVERLQNNPALIDVRFISISSNPTVDKSKKLMVYSSKFYIENEQWHILSGSPKITKKLSKLLFGPELTDYKQHVKYLNVFDQQGELAGSYEYNNATHIGNLRRKLIQLTKKDSRPKAPEPPEEVK